MFSRIILIDNSTHGKLTKGKLELFGYLATRSLLNAYIVDHNGMWIQI